MIIGCVVCEWHSSDFDFESEDADAPPIEILREVKLHFEEDHPEIVLVAEDSLRNRQARWN